MDRTLFLVQFPSQSAESGLQMLEVDFKDDKI